MPDKRKSGEKAPAESTTEIRKQQHTGNHDKPAREQGGSDRFGGTRKGAENVEPKR